MLMHPELLKRTPRRAAPAVLEPGPQHGYAVIESLRAGSGDTLDLPIGKVYPALHRLEPAGLIAGDWQTVAGRRHRAYHLSSRRHCARRASRRVRPVLHRRHCPPEQAKVASHRIATSIFVRLQRPLATHLSDLAAPLCGPQRRVQCCRGRGCDRC